MHLINVSAKLNRLKLSILACGLGLFCSLAGATDAPLPSIENILKGVKDQAEKESDQDRLFKQRYAYSRSKVTEYCNSDGEVTKREAQTSSRKPRVTMVSYQPHPRTTPVAQKQAESAASSAIRENAFDKKDLLVDDDLVNRFAFTVVGRETLNGRSAIIVDFKPADKKTSGPQYQRSIHQSRVRTRLGGRGGLLTHQGEPAFDR